MSAPSSLPSAAPNRPTRVVHILGNFRHGGLQGLVLNLIKELPAFAHTVVVLTDKGGPLHPRYADVCEVVSCDYPRGQTVAFLVRLTRLLRHLRPDAVLAHLFGNHTLVSWAGALAGVPKTYAVSTNDPVFFARSRWKPMLLAQLARPFCAGEVAVSESVGRILTSRLHLPARRVRVIHNGCPVAEIAERAAAARARSPEVPHQPPQVFMAAAIGRGKDHPTALRAIDALRRAGRPVELWLAGTPFRESNRTRLEELAESLGISDLVRFLGGHDDVPELMATSDAVIHISDSEGFSLAVLEAMAAAAPVIASDIPPCREALDDGRCGMLVPPGDVAALAEAIGRVLDEEPLRRRLVAAASDRVASRFDIKQMAAAYAALFV